MDEPAFMLLQLQENLRFLRTQAGAHVLSCMSRDDSGETYWTYVLLTYDSRGNVKEYHEPYNGHAEWTNHPLEALKRLHLKVAALVTDRLAYDCSPALRTLDQQRDDEALENNNLSAGNHLNETRHGMQPMASSSASQSISERFKSQISDNPPSYQTQEMNPARMRRSFQPSDRDTLDSIDRVSSTKLRKMQNFDNVRTDLSQSSPTASWFFKSRDGSTTSANSQTNRGFDRDRPSFQTSTAQRDRLRSSRTQSRTAGLGIPSSIPEKSKPESQTFPINALSSSQYPRVQSQQLRSRDESFSKSPAGKAVQSPMQSSRAQLSRSVNATNLSRGIHGMQALRSITSNEDIYQHPNTTALPQPLSSHPPYPDESVFIKLPRETWDLRNTDPQEFRRRVDAYERDQLIRTREPIAPIEFEAAEFLNEDTEPLIDDDAFVSLATRIRDYGIRSPESMPGSPASDETVTPYDPHRRRVTQTRWRDNEAGDPLPPAAPSPPPNSAYPSNLPVYPPTLVSSGSEVVMQRDASNAGRTSSTARGNTATGLSSSNDSARRPTPSRAGSVASLARLNALDEHDSKNEHLLGHEGGRGGTRRVSQIHKEDQGDKYVPFIYCPVYPCSSSVSSTPSIPLPMKMYQNCELMIPYRFTFSGLARAP
jgi:hypothetical protein